MRYSITIFGLLLLIFISSTCNKKDPFEKAKEIGTIEALEDFIKENPESDFTQNAMVIIDSLRFEKIFYSDSVSKFELFIQTYPESRFVEKAKERIIDIYFNKAKTINTISSYETFIKTYKNSKYIEYTKKAKNLLDSLYLYPIKQNNKYGYINKKGIITIKPQFDYAGDFNDGLGLV